MTSYISAGVAGVVLAIVAILGGVSAITPSANTQDQTDAVIVYDAG